MRRGDNGIPVDKEFTSGLAEERTAFDRLPKRVRAALASAKFEYPSVQIWQVFEEVKRQLAEYGIQTTADAVWDQIIPMIAINDVELSRKNRQEYEQLAVSFAEGRRARIEAIFQRAS